MRRVRIDGEFHVPSTFAEGVDERLGIAGRHNLVERAMKSPNRRPLQPFYSFRETMKDYSATADGRDGGKAGRPKRAQIPGAESAHTQACQVESLIIDGKSRSTMKKELVEPIRQLRPPGVPRTLRRNDYEGKIGMLDHIGRESFPQDSGRILARLTNPVQEQDGRAFLIGAALRPLGNIQEIIKMKRLGEPELSSHNL